MTIRILPAFGSSVVLHLLTGMGALWFASAASRPAKLTRHAPHATAVFVVAPTEDSEFAGLKPIDRTHDDPFIRRGDDSTVVSLGAYTFDVAKIGDRARVLFPFLTPDSRLSTSPWRRNVRYTRVLATRSHQHVPYDQTPMWAGGPSCYPTARCSR